MESTRTRKSWWPHTRAPDHEVRELVGSLEASFRTSWNKYSWSLADIHSKMNDHSFSSFLNRYIYIYISIYIYIFDISSISAHIMFLYGFVHSRGGSLALVRLYKQGQGDSESNIFSTWQIRCQLSIRELFFRFVWINFCSLATFWLEIYTTYID